MSADTAACGWLLSGLIKEEGLREWWRWQTPSCVMYTVQTIAPRLRVSQNIWDAQPCREHVRKEMMCFPFHPLHELVADFRVVPLEAVIDC